MRIPAVAVVGLDLTGQSVVAKEAAYRIGVLVPEDARPHEEELEKLTDSLNYIARNIGLIASGDVKGPNGLELVSMSLKEAASDISEALNNVAEAIRETVP